MATEAQVVANRANAQKSTGPRTPKGKAKVAQNAVQHGLLAKEAVVVGEDFDQFDLYRERIRAELAPVGLVESLLAERIVGLSWRLQRAERFHTEAFDTMYENLVADPRARPAAVGPDRGDPIFGTVVVKDFSQTRVLERLMMYERRIEGSLYRTMAELRKLQGQRQAGEEGEEVSSLNCKVSGRQGRASRTPPSDFTLDNLLAAIAALEETPHDGTTNAPADPSCETNPICGGPGKEVGRGRPAHEEGPPKREKARLGTQKRLTASLRTRRWPRGKRAKQSQFPPVRGKGKLVIDPSFAGADEDQTPGGTGFRLNKNGTPGVYTSRRKRGAGCGQAEKARSSTSEYEVGSIFRRRSMRAVWLRSVGAERTDD